MSPKAENLFSVKEGQQVVKQVDHHKRNASTGLVFNSRSRQPFANSTSVLPDLKKLTRNQALMKSHDSQERNFEKYSNRLKHVNLEMDKLLKEKSYYK
jgi:hypothetical protein